MGVKLYYDRYDNYSYRQTDTKFPGVVGTGSFLRRSYKYQSRGDTNPHWREQVIREENACTPRTVTYISNVNQNAQFQGTYLHYPTMAPHVISSEGFLFAHPPIMNEMAVDWNPARAQGRSKAIAKLHAAHHSAMGGVIAGQITQTLHMLRHPLEALRSGFHNYFAAVEHRVRDNRSKTPKKVKIRGVNQRSKRDTVRGIVADTYLEYVFGWQPALSDVKDIITALDRLLTQHEVTRADSKYIERFSGPSSSTPKTQFSLNLREEKRVKAKYILSTKAALRPIVSHDFHTQFGLDFESFAPTVYELVPWSFVLDYFLNVQDLMNAAFTVRSELIYASQTEIRETVNTHLIKWNGTYSVSAMRSPGVIKNNVGVFTETVKVIERECSLQFPPLVFTVPARNQLINMAALLASHNKATYAIRGS